MRLRCAATVLAVLLFSPLICALAAQQPVRVLRHAPADTARPGDVITISFDRPVAGSVEHTPDPSRLVRIVPPLDARTEWRDPATIRVIPRTPLTPGRRYRVSVSNEFTAVDGGRFAAPYEFTLTTRGPAILSSAPGLRPGYAETLEPNGRLRIVYSAPIDSVLFGRTARLEIARGANCAPRSIRYTVHSQRPPTDSDGQLRYAPGWDRDTAETQFRRLVELHPVTSVPEECSGSIVLPSLDPNDRQEVRYPIATARRFALERMTCLRDDCAAGDDLWLDFTAPVRREALLSRLHLAPAVRFTIPPNDGASTRWKLAMPVRPRTTYRVRLDSSLTDVFGRRIAARIDSLVVGDRHPSLGHQLGFFNVSRARPAVRLTHVNVDRAIVVFVPIPDSLRTTIVRLSDDPDSVARIVSHLRDSVVRRVALTSAHNVERITDVAIPPTLLTAQRGRPFAPLLAMRAREVARPSSNDITSVEIVGPTRPSFTRLARRVAIVQVTDLIAQAKVSDDWGAVLVTDANDGRPVTGAQIATLDDGGRVVGTGATDSTGVAQIGRSPSRTRGPLPLPEFSRPYAYRNTGIALVEATHGADRALTPLVGQTWNRQDAVEQLGGQLTRTRLTHASTFADRGIYRPGEIVYLTSILRFGAESALRLPERGDSIRVRVALPRTGSEAGRVVRDTVLRVGPFGTAADSFRLAGAATLGTYQVAVSGFDGAWQHAGSTSFAVAEYRAPEFETSVTLDTGIFYRGDTVRAHASGRYYFGPAMRGAVLRWSASMSESQGGVSVPGLPSGYTIGLSYAGRSTMRQPQMTQRTGVDTLDADGRASFDIATPASGEFPLYVSVSVAATDANRQVVGAYGATLAHSSSIYVAAHDTTVRQWYWKDNAPRTFTLLTVRPDGQRVADVRIGITVLRHHMSVGSDGDGQYPSTAWVTDTVLRDSTRTRDTPTPYTFTPRLPGWHEVVFTGVDERGRSFVTGMGGYVIGHDGVPWVDNPVRLGMHIERSDLSVGDSVAVQFISPFPRAEAWVTVEREAVLAQRRLIVGSGESVVRLPVTEAFFPGAQVSVVLVDSGSVWRADSVPQRIRAGYASINVTRSARQLRVEVKPQRRELAPGDSAAITVSVRDHASHPVQAHVTLWAVDEAALALAYYTRPDPLTALHATGATGLTFVSSATDVAVRRRFLPPPPGWEIGEFDALRKLSADFSGSGAAYGSAAGNGLVSIRTQTPRSNFRTTAFYLASLLTDADGNVTATAKLPDNVTRYRVIAVAASAGDSYGSGDSILVVTKPLLARASLPRFVREGDTLLAGAVVNNNTGSDVAARISATSVGLRAQGDAIATRMLANGTASEVRFTWRNTALTGDTARVRFTVDAGANGDIVDARVPVRAPYSPRYHAASGVARDTATIRMMLPATIDPARSRLTLRVGNSPIPFIRAAYWQLDAYPYLCSEQLTSNGRVILAMLRLQRAGLADSALAPTARTLRGRLQFVVDELSRRQSSRGGIGYWTANTWTTRWLSSYAGTLLVDARDAGFAVDSGVVTRLVNFLQADPDTTSNVAEEAYGTREERRRAVASRLADDLAELQFLRRAGAASAARENRLVAQSAGMMWEDRVWLVDLLGRRQDRTAARAQLARVWRDVETASIRADIPDSLLQTSGFPSHIRPVARLLRATLAVDPNHERLAALVERVVQQGRAERSWAWNTQDFAWSSDALADLALSQRDAGPPPTITVRSALPGRSRRALMTASHDSSIALDGLLERDGEWMALPVRVESSGGRAFYVLTVEEVPLVVPTTPDAKGLIVERWFERFDDGQPVTEVREGELVRGRLRVTVPSDREFVAVEDLLPAGLEVVDMSLRTSTLGPFESEGSREAATAGNRANAGGATMPWLYGDWSSGWWSPWEHKEVRDDRVLYFARMLWKGSYTASYVARATTAGTFIKPPAHAEEMYNPSLGGRSDGGTFRVTPKP